MASETIEVLHLVAAELDRIGIPYAVGGSVASGLYGEPRSTHDVDLLLDLGLDDVPRLVAALEDRFYLQAAAAREAIARCSSFQAVHRKLHVKVDLFIRGENALDRDQIERRIRRTCSDDDPRSVFMTSPEVIVLRKLDWYRMTNETSDRQWRDVVGVIKVSGTRLDFPYLQRMASTLGTRALLDRALREAGRGPA